MSSEIRKKTNKNSDTNQRVNILKQLKYYFQQNKQDFLYISVIFLIDAATLNIGCYTRSVCMKVWSCE